MKKLLPYCLIALLAISLVACKGNGGGSSSNSSTTTPTTNTPLQGTWKDTANGETFVFNGNAFSQKTVLSSTPEMSLTTAGTFRLDNGNIYFTITSVTGINDTTTYANKDEVEAGFSMTFPFAVGTELLYGSYAVNGNTLTMTANSHTYTYTKQ